MSGYFLSLNLNRRALLARLGAGGLAAGGLPAALAWAGERSLRLDLTGLPSDITGPRWAFGGDARPPIIRAERGDTLKLSVKNTLAFPVALDWAGFDRHVPEGAGGELSQLVPGMEQVLSLSLDRAGTFFVRARGLGNAGGAALPVAALIVTGQPPAETDHAVIIAPAGAKTAAVPVTVNGLATPELTLARTGLTRLRLINAAEREIFTIAIPDHDMRVVAIDSRPSEPFVARSRMIQLAPGSRVDVEINAPSASAEQSQKPSAIVLRGQTDSPIAKLVLTSARTDGKSATPRDASPNDDPSGGELSLTRALRIDLGLSDTIAAPWRPFGAPNLTSTPAFKVPSGQTVVLAASNKTQGRVTLRVHGHGCRLLDKLDDGWKPFWLDTLPIVPGDTARLAFRAGERGRWLVEAIPENTAQPITACHFEVT